VTHAQVREHQADDRGRGRGTQEAQRDATGQPGHREQDDERRGRAERDHALDRKIEDPGALEDELAEGGDEQRRRDDDHRAQQVGVDEVRGGHRPTRPRTAASTPPRRTSK
jgi:hypothetical protein